MATQEEDAGPGKLIVVLVDDHRLVLENISVKATPNHWSVSDCMVT